MVTTLINAALLSTLETCLQQVLALDPAAGKKLAALSGNVLRIHCDLPAITADLVVSDDRLLLLQGGDVPADTEIRGSAAALLRLLAKRNTASLKADGVVITGDAGLLDSLRKILQDLDVDWEYRLSNVIGDVPTQTISDTLAAAGRFTRQAGANLRQDIDDYLHEEKKLFPAAAELERHYAGIDALRLRVDRLAARLRKLESRPQG